MWAQVAMESWKQPLCCRNYRPEYSFSQEPVVQKAQALSSTLISTNRSCFVEKTLYDHYYPFALLELFTCEVLNLNPDLPKGVGYGPFRDTNRSPNPMFC